MDLLQLQLCTLAKENNFRSADLNHPPKNEIKRSFGIFLFLKSSDNAIKLYAASLRESWSFIKFGCAYMEHIGIVGSHEKDWKKW